MKDVEVERRQRNAAQKELRRLVSHRQGPSDVDEKAFGPWARYIRPLRVIYQAKGIDACRKLFLEAASENPELGTLLSAGEEPRKTFWWWSSLCKTNFAEPAWVAPDLIPAGLVSIGGRPKIGKSWLAMQIACAVGTGGRVLGRQVEKGKVLYLALEDSPRRLKARGLRQLWPEEAYVCFATEWPCLAEGGTAALRSHIEQDGYTLVIVDTLTRVLGGADQMDLAETAQIMGDLQRLTQELDVTVLVMDHHRKSNGFHPDPVDDLLGSTGKAQPLDGVIGLYRERGKKEGTLRVTGRDVEETQVPLVFDGLTCTWQAARVPGEAKANSAPAAVLEAIRALRDAGELAYGSRVAKMLGRDPSNVGRAVAELLQEGLVREGERQGNITPLYLAEEAEPPQAVPMRERVTVLPNLAAMRQAVAGGERAEVGPGAQEPQVPQEPGGVPQGAADGAGEDVGEIPADESNERRQGAQGAQRAPTPQEPPGHAEGVGDYRGREK